MIRKIAQHDKHIITEMLSDLNYESTIYSEYPRNYEYVMENLEEMVDLPNFIGLIDEDYRGFMIGAMDVHWFTPVKYAVELLLFVQKEYRGGSLAFRLVRAFEGVAREQGCYEIRAGASTGINEERTIQLYEREGYSRFATPVRKVL